MAVMQYVLVRAEKADAPDPFPMQGIELDQIAATLKLSRNKRLELHPDDFGWEVLGASNIIFTEVVYHPRLFPERLLVKAPEGGDLKTTFDLAKALGEHLGANVFNLTTGECVGLNFPGVTAQEQQKAKELEQAKTRSGCLGAVFMILGSLFHH